jgi:hypothetical protein
MKTKPLFARIFDNETPLRLLERLGWKMEHSETRAEIPYNKGRIYYQEFHHETDDLVRLSIDYHEQNAALKLYVADHIGRVKHHTILESEIAYDGGVSQILRVMRSYDGNNLILKSICDGSINDCFTSSIIDAVNKYHKKVCVNCENYDNSVFIFPLYNRVPIYHFSKLNEPTIIFNIITDIDHKKFVTNGSLNSKLIAKLFGCGENSARIDLTDPSVDIEQLIEKLVSQMYL